MRRARILASTCLWALWCTVACADEPVARLGAAIAERLALIEEVARFKWNARLPAMDDARESVLLARALHDADELGLDTDFARAVVEAQLDASRALQTAAFERWTSDAQPPFRDTLDLVTELRPALERATHALLVATRDSRAAFADCPEPPRPAKPQGIDAAVWALAVQPFAAQTCE